MSAETSSLLTAGFTTLSVVFVALAASAAVTKFIESITGK